MHAPGVLTLQPNDSHLNDSNPTTATQRQSPQRQQPNDSNPTTATQRQPPNDSHTATQRQQPNDNNKSKNHKQRRYLKDDERNQKQRLQSDNREQCQGRIGKKQRQEGQHPRSNIGGATLEEQQRKRKSQKNRIDIANNQRGAVSTGWNINEEKRSKWNAAGEMPEFGTLGGGTL
ncbi:MAG: hypothetical protein Q9204_004319 [Flavoplaca sp. TL-2023a]